MPYHRHRRRRYRKKAGVSGWKRKKKPRTSALVRQTEQNRKEIKKLKHRPEIKFCGSTTAESKSNFCGHIMQQQEVDAYGLGMSSADWLGVQGSLLPSSDYELYNPVMQMPIVVAQGVGEKQRIANEIKMRSLVIKGTIVGGDAADNAGIYAGRQVKQTMHMFVLLDKAPPPANPSLTSSPYNPTYQVDSIPCQLFDYSTSWMPVNTINGVPRRSLSANLKSLPNASANPPGPHCGNDTDMDNITQSYWSRDDDGIGKSDRFKLLKYKKFHLTQQSQAGAADGLQAYKTATHFTEVIKAPYTFEFASDKAVVPDNQRLLIVFCSNTPTKRPTSTGGPTPTWQDPTDYCVPPKVSTLCRLYFTDS